MIGLFIDFRLQYSHAIKVNHTLTYTFASDFILLGFWNSISYEKKSKYMVDSLMKGLNGYYLMVS